MFRIVRDLTASPNYLVTYLMGFAAGLPLALTAGLLEARFSLAGQSTLFIANVMTLIALPYVLKPLWAPIFDRFRLPYLGRRCGWILSFQAIIVIIILLMAFTDTTEHPGFLVIMASVLALCSASQDIVIDAYRTELLLPEERGIGMAYYVMAYRCALLFAGGLGFILAGRYGFKVAYCVMALTMLVGIITTMCAPEQIHHTQDKPQPGIQVYFGPLREFFSRPFACLLLALIISYKFGDAFAAKLMTTFFTRELGFSLVEIGTVNKFGGFIAIISGAFIGGLYLKRYSLFSGLMLFAGLQAISNLMFVVLAYVGNDMFWFFTTIVTENFCSGMGTSAFLALLMSLCDQRFTATQYALFSAFASVPREILGPVAGYLITHFGWINFYLITFICSFPSLLLLWLARQVVQDIENAPTLATSVRVAN